MSKKYVFSVQSLSEPLRLDTFLSKQDIFSSRSQVQNLIKKNQVKVNGYVVKGSYTVKEEDSVDIICDKFQTTKDILTEYNDLDNIGIGSKIIIPSKDE